MSVTKTRTSTMLKERFLDLLFHRVILSDFFAMIAVAGLAEVVDRGGNVDGIRTDDIRPFVAVMAGSEDRFHYAPLDVNQLYPEHLLRLIGVIRESTREEA